jgi:hypothetical protein
LGWRWHAAPLKTGDIPQQESTGALVVRENPQQRFAFDENSLYVSNNYSIQWHPKDSAPPIERRIAALIQ